MKYHMILTVLMMLNLAGCTSTQNTENTTKTTDLSNPIAIQEEAIKKADEPTPTAAKKIRIEQPLDTMTKKVLTGIVDTAIHSTIKKHETNQK